MGDKGKANPSGKDHGSQDIRKGERIKDSEIGKYTYIENNKKLRDLGGRVTGKAKTVRMDKVEKGIE